VLALIVALVAACTGSGHSGLAPRSTSSDLSSVLTATAAGQPVRQRFGGWDSEFGTYAFKLDWTISATGRINGRLEAVIDPPQGVDHTVSRVTGTAGPRNVKSHRTHITVSLSPRVGGLSSMSGYVDDTHVFLQSPTDSSIELLLYGTTATTGFNRHARMMEGPGGYVGWLRRHAVAHTVVRRVDVDGDGRRDLVVVLWRRLVDPFIGSGTREVIVHFAAGTTSTLDVGAANTADRSAPVGWTSTVHLPGLAGHQLALTWDIGASNTFFHVVGDVDGRLRLIPAPPGEEWGWGGTVGTGTIGQFCNDGTLTFSFVHYSDNALREQRLKLSRYVWHSDHWVLVSRLDRLVTQRQLDRLLPRSTGPDWNCA